MKIHNQNKQHPEENPRPQRVKQRRLAEDGLPLEMFQDVKRACHRWLMTEEGAECDAYRHERRAIDHWMRSNNIPNHHSDRAE